MGTVKNSGVFKGVSAKGQIAKGLAKAGVVFYRQYDSATQAVIDSANSKSYTLPSNITPLDNLIKNLKTISTGAFWNRLDTIFLSSIIGNSATHHGLRKLNLKNPSGQERVFYGGLSLNSYGGIQGNGTNAYIDHVTPLNTYTNFKQDDAGIIVVKSTDPASILLQPDTIVSVILRGVAGNFNRLNSTNSTSFDNSGLGAVGISRNNSTQQISFNKTVATTITSASLALKSMSVRQFTNGSTTYYAGDDLAVLIGASYTQSELNLFRTYFNQYLTESGFSAIA